MPGIGDPPSAPPAEPRTTHGAPAPVAYVPLPRSRGAAAGLRPAGRRAEETRPCRLRAGSVPNAAGSAYLEQGRTKIIATVYGPRQAGERAQLAAEGLLLLELHFAPFCSRFESKEDNERRGLLYASILQRTLESVVLLGRYGKLAFDVSILVLEDDGAVLSAALTAASLALADARVEMRDLAAGATAHIAAGIGNASSTLLLDCEGEEERSLPEGSAVLHLGLCPARGSLCLLHSVGPLAPEFFEQMVLLAKETAEIIGTEMRRCLEESVERRAAKRARMAACGDEGASIEAEGHASTV